LQGTAVPFLIGVHLGRRSKGRALAAALASMFFWFSFPLTVFPTARGYFASAGSAGAIAFLLIGVVVHRLRSQRNRGRSLVA
jgi:hypothetical protein